MLKLIRFTFIIFCFFFIIFYYCRTSIAVEYIPEIHGNDIEKVLRTYGKLSGIAVETYFDGHFGNSIGVVFFNLDDKIIRKISFNFDRLDAYEKGNVVYDEFYLTEVQKYNIKKISIKGKNSFGFNFLGEISIKKNKIVFYLQIQGAGTVEIKELSIIGKELKNKFLPKLDLGIVNR